MVVDAAIRRRSALANRGIGFLTTLVGVTFCLAWLVHQPHAFAEPADPAPARLASVAKPKLHRIGATTTITEVSTGLPFPARVDTGAKSCSIHCEKIEIENASAKPEENVG